MRLRKDLSLDRFQLIGDLVRGKRVLDIGCVEHNAANAERNFWLHEYVRRSAAETLGLDASADQIQILQQKGYNVICADATAFHLQRTFDMIVAGETLEHLANPGGFLQCAREHLTAGEGRLLLTTPNANCLAYFLENLALGHELDNDDHIALYSPRTMTSLLKRYGFQVEQFIFIAQSTAYLHDNALARGLVHLKQAGQVTLGLLRPSLCQHFLTMAKPA